MSSVAVRPGSAPAIALPSGVKVWHYRDLDGDLIARVYTHGDRANLPGHFGEIAGDRPAIGLNGLLIGTGNPRLRTAPEREDLPLSRAEIETEIESHLAPFGWLFVNANEADIAKELRDRAIADAQRLAEFSIRIGIAENDATVYASDCVVLPSENDRNVKRLAAALRDYADRLEAESNAGIIMGEVYKAPRGVAP